MTTMKPIRHTLSNVTAAQVRVVLCAGIGISLGVALGIASQNLLVGILLGLGIGAGTGVALEQQHRNAPNDLDPTLWACTPLLVFAATVAAIWFL